MEFTQIFQSIIAFIFVLGLLFTTLWLIKFCQQKGINCRLSKCFNDKNRIKIIELHRIDTKNTITLISCDKDEFFVLLGSSSNLILKQNKKKVSSNE